jgi:hypothetical protein
MRMHPEVGYVVFLAGKRRPAGNLPVARGNGDPIRSLHRKGIEGALYMGNYGRVWRAGMPGIAAHPRRKSDLGDRALVGGRHQPDGKVRYHHFAGENVPAACSMTCAVLNSVSSSNGLPMS